MNLDDFVREVGRLETPAADAAEGCRKDWDGSPPPTIRVAEMARALVGAHVGGSEVDWPGVLSIVEDALVKGDQFLSDVVATGFLEALVSGTIRRGSGEEVVRSHLGEESKAYVHAWENLGVDQSSPSDPSASSGS